MSDTPVTSRHTCVVEDDPALREMLQSYLTRHGFEVTALSSAEALFERLARGSAAPDAIVLDVGLPGMSGRDACQRLRHAGHRVPILLLSAHDDEIDRVLGLEFGADDYVGKPFSARELLARLQALMRRASAAPAGWGPPGAAEARVNFGRCVFLRDARQLVVDGEPRLLSTVEHALLTEFCANPGTVLSRERLFNASHTRSDAALLRAVDAAIMRLRRVVEPDPAEPRYIQTVRNRGYVFVPHGHAGAA